jgi:hypothetical protein
MFLQDILVKPSMLRIRIRIDPSLIYSLELDPKPVSECGPELGYSYKKAEVGTR